MCPWLRRADCLTSKWDFAEKRLHQHKEACIASNWHQEVSKKKLKGCKEAKKLPVSIGTTNKYDIAMFKILNRYYIDIFEILKYLKGRPREHVDHNLFFFNSRRFPSLTWVRVCSQNNLFLILLFNFDLKLDRKCQVWSLYALEEYQIDLIWFVFCILTLWRGS